LKVEFVPPGNTTPSVSQQYDFASETFADAGKPVGWALTVMTTQAIKNAAKQMVECPKQKASAPAAFLRKKSETLKQKNSSFLKSTFTKIEVHKTLEQTFCQGLFPCGKNSVAVQRISVPSNSFLKSLNPVANVDDIITFQLKQRCQRILL